MIRHVVTDIEGTTTAISFVKVTLFDHARRALPSFVAARAGEPAVREALDAAKALAGDPAMSDGAAVAALLRWIDEDRKATPLKALQGMIWEDGYRSGAYRAHLYPDVAGALRRWKARGLGLSVFSSGSVLAQKLLFAHTTEGDLTPLFDRYFDTTTGPKAEPGSYEKIAEALGAAPAEVLFLSDVGAELDAAAAAGLARVAIAREGAPPPSGHPAATSFDEIEIDEGSLASEALT
jgi:enolase-phosphatase E1